MDFIDLGLIVKSPLDRNSYKCIKLRNGMKVLMISNSAQCLPISGRKSTEKCPLEKIIEFNSRYVRFARDVATNATILNSRIPFPSEPKDPNKTKIYKPSSKNEMFIICLVVGVGMMHDPADAPGLAHFYEHCIFLSNRKIKGVDGFMKFVDHAGGESNARTEALYTSYYFTIPIHSLEEALDLFVEMIVNPRLDDRIIRPEVDAVHSEFVMKRLDENFRVLGMLQSFCVEGHPLGNFGLGSRETLGKCKNLSKLVVDWKEKYYYAGNMTLVMRGPLPIEVIEQKVLQNFWRIPYRNEVVSPSQQLLFQNEQNPFDSSKWNDAYMMKCSGDHSWLKFAWALPPQASKSLDTEPLSFIREILSDKTNGSLDYLLRKKNLITSICTDCPVAGFFKTGFCTVFVLTLNLTSKGLMNYETVIRHLASYIEMLKQQVWSEGHHLFDDMQQVRLDAFHHWCHHDYYLQEDPVRMDTAIESSRLLAELVHSEKPCCLLLSTHLITDYDRVLVSSMVEHLELPNACILLGSYDFEFSHFQIESNYGTCFSRLHLSPQLQNYIKKPKNTGFFLPKANSFVEKMVCRPMTDEAMPFENGHLFLEDESISVMYTDSFIKCDENTPPVAYYVVRLQPAATFSEAYFLARVKLWADIIKHYLDYRLSKALSSTIKYDISFEAYEMNLSVKGPSRILPEIFKSLIKTHLQLETLLEPQLFRNMKQKLISELKYTLRQGEQFAEELIREVLMGNYIGFRKTLNLIQGTTMSSFIDFLLSCRECVVEGLIGGIVSESQVKSVIHTMKLLKRGVSKTDLAKVSREKKERIKQLPRGETCIFSKCPMEDDNTIVLRCFYQLNISSKRQQRIWEILQSSISGLLFETLRSKERLGYVVEDQLLKIGANFGYNILVVSESQRDSMKTILERLDRFMLWFYRIVLTRTAKYTEKIKCKIQKNEGILQKEVKEEFFNQILSSGRFYRRLNIVVSNDVARCFYNPEFSMRSIYVNVEEYIPGSVDKIICRRTRKRGYLSNK